MHMYIHGDLGQRVTENFLMRTGRCIACSLRWLMEQLKILSSVLSFCSLELQPTPWDSWKQPFLQSFHFIFLLIVFWEVYSDRHTEIHVHASTCLSHMEKAWRIFSVKHLKIAIFLPQQDDRDSRLDGLLSERASLAMSLLHISMDKIHLEQMMLFHFFLVLLLNN